MTEREITGNTFYLDIRLNRFIVAGNVTLQRGDVSVQGAAFTEYLDFDRAYFLPVGNEPDRWTYAKAITRIRCVDARCRATRSIYPTFRANASF